ncbi:class I SAM-dependent methyltransferase [Streptococcus sobrinus]|uniref:class I SAM-dependent methyltransferase n=1 Tax=Streptococcus sobrinus TaxID=1310 RepID=UPI0002DCD800|nr:class I SAM-dependent methyltransferase [Streptococcus sobrinus]
MTKKEVGHNFLARLGKKRLRPGGIGATNWLIKEGGFSKDSQVLEVACNQGTTSIELAQTFGCKIIGIDRDRAALDKAKKSVQAAQLEDLIQLQEGNAMKLPFPDNSFDIVINEAMLTMLSEKAKIKAVKEYYRVLKPGGCILTHDVSFSDKHLEDKLAQLRQTINANVSPLHVDKWQELFKSCGFSQVNYDTGRMTLMSITGMIKDEGLLGACRIFYRGMKKENRQQFLQMYRFFNKTGKELGYIAVSSQK